MARGNDVQLGGITDLVLLADIKPGFVDALEVVSHVDRLRKVLRTLNALRLGSRESSWPASPFTDIVARWRIVHSFRWAVVEGVNGAPDRLLLSVNFDGGWEPYMRVIWDQLGSTLDLILCHATDYPLSCGCSFETYAAWVRAHEVSADFLFIESGRTVSDAEYLRALEAAQRERPRNRTAARLHTAASGDSPALPPAGSPQAHALARAAFTPLSALFTLQRYFGAGAPDGECLRRASRDILFELVQLDTPRLFPIGSAERARFAEALYWFESAPRPQLVPQDRLEFKPADIQAGMLSKPPVDRGALLLLMVVDPARALAWLGALPLVGEGEAPPDGLWLQLAMSLAGLRKLGLPEARLARFPQAFKEGMAARAGVLGDVRHNHPRQWRWPRRAQGNGRVDPAAVHLLLQVRFASAGGGELFGPPDEARLQAAIQQLLPASSGLLLLGIERMRNRPDTREAFGFKDGISQPSAEPPTTPPEHWNDWVERGELLLGYRTDRDRQYPVPEKADELLDNGSFLVIRKLRQDTAALEAQTLRESHRLRLPQGLLLAKLMGRWRDGRPLGAPAAPACGNDFNYDADADGKRCPFHAHVRRANPRQAPDEALRRKMPRILRRGMSYDPPHDAGPEDADDRGLVFMAYNAQLAEQFEVIQRWMSGANASGGYSGQADPLLGVVDPATQEPRLYPFEHAGQTYAMQLGDKPFVSLQWGAYFFVPSRPALKALPGLIAAPALAARTPVVTLPTTMEGWQLWLEDPNSRDAAWAHVRAVGGVLDTGSDYGVLVGGPEAVCTVLRNKEGRYSVSGYAERMRASIGQGFLGLDDGPDYQAQAPGVNAVIESYTEADAARLARGVAARLIALTRQSALPGAVNFTLDLEWLSLTVIRELCKLWFGLPDGEHLFGLELDGNGQPRQPQCPQSLFPVSRQVFWPHPSKRIRGAGELSGQAFMAGIKAWLTAHPQGGGALTPALLAALPAGADIDLKARTLAGVVLGFPPTTHGNLLTVMAALMTTLPLGEIQQAWLAAAGAPQQQAAWMRERLTQVLCARPAPFAVWRTATVGHELAGVAIPRGKVLVVGLASATQASGRHEITFGGSRQDPEGAPRHACSGYGMGMGVMQGVLAALLDAGPLQSTGAPTSVLVGLG
ncbi:MAG: Dyp-type peroxidase [Burkholderiales bacterium]|nr:Dyp-type peroxidase [Burkholderiales bacterium]